MSWPPNASPNLLKKDQDALWIKEFAEIVNYFELQSDNKNFALVQTA